MMTVRRETDSLFPATGIISSDDARELIVFLSEAQMTPTDQPFTATIMLRVEREFADSQTSNREEDNFWQRVDPVSLTEGQLAHLTKQLSDALTNRQAAISSVPHATPRRSDRWIEATVTMLS
jgi:hypothetical protein